MPLYEYKCDQCGDVFEVMQKFADAPLTVHEKCGGPVRRLISAPALQFKGSGWYITDYAKGNSGSSAGSGNPSSGSKSSGESTASDTSSSTPAPAATTSSSESGTK